MSTYTDFCNHYDLDPDEPDSKIQYREYRESYDVLMSIVSK